MYGVVPPVALAVALPSLKPLQLTSLTKTALAVKTGGSLINTLAVFVQDCASVTVTTWVPAPRPVAVAVN